MLNGSCHGNPHAASVEMEIEAGTKGVALKLALGGRLEGTVVDAQGALVDGADLVLVFKDKPGYTNGRNVTDGVFKLNGVPPRPFAIYAKTKDGRMSNAYVDPIVPGTTQSGITLTLAPAAQLSLTAPDSAERIFFDLVSETGFFSTEYVSAGRTFHVSVPPGAYTVTARAGKKKPHGEAMVNAVAGETVKVEIPFEAESDAGTRSEDEASDESDRDPEPSQKLMLAGPRAPSNS